MKKSTEYLWVNRFLDLLDDIDMDKRTDQGNEGDKTKTVWMKVPFSKRHGESV